MVRLKITAVDLKQEIIEVENCGDVTISLEGIKLVDKDAKNTFTFPKSAELNAREKLTLYCAAGKLQEDELEKLEAQEKEDGGNVFLWRTKEGNPRKQCVLNDTGEHIKLMDAQDKVLDTFDERVKEEISNENIDAIDTSELVLDIGPSAGESIGKENGDVDTNQSTKAPPPKSNGGRRQSFIELAKDQLYDFKEHVEDMLDSENNEYQEITGETVFQKFPLPEVRGMTKERDKFWVSSCCMLIFSVIFTVGFVLYYIRNTQRVVGFRTISLEKHLLIRSTGCDVTFNHLPIDVKRVQTNRTQNSTLHYVSGTSSSHQKGSTANGTGTTNIGGSADYTNTTNAAIATNNTSGSPFIASPNLLEYWTNRFAMMTTDLAYLYKNLYRDQDKCAEKGNWNAKDSRFCISYIYNANLLYPEPSMERMKDPNYFFMNDGSKVSFAPKNPTIAEIVGFESLGSRTKCKINVWTIHPLKKVTILQSGRKISVVKVDNDQIYDTRTAGRCKDGSGTCVVSSENPGSLHERKVSRRTPSEGKQYTFYEYSSYSYWKLNIGVLEINGTNVDIKMTNFEAKHIKILLENGDVRLHGVQISNSTTRFGCSDDEVGNLFNTPQGTKFCNHTIRVGFDHGTTIGIGKFQHTNSSSCGTSAKSCEGNVYLTVLSSTRFVYSQNGGAVCAASSTIMEEASNCILPDYYKGKGSNNSSNTGNSSSDFSTSPSGVCKGSAILCKNKTCPFRAEMATMDVSVLEGGLYLGVIDYEATDKVFKNKRKTIDGVPCIFPFEYKEKVYWECTSEGMLDSTL